jgi:MFS family permease
MLALSLGWSTGSLALGQYIDRMGRKRSAVIGSILLIAGCGGTLTFSAHTRVATAFAWFLLAGMGMGFVTLSTLLKVQPTVSQADLGVATGSHQFARTLGGTVGVGVCGGLVISRLTGAVDALKQSGALNALPQEQLSHIRSNLESLFSPEIHNQLPHPVQLQLQTAVADGMTWSFVLITAVAVVCLAVCISLPGGKRHKTA